MFTTLDLQMAKNKLAQSRNGCRYSLQNNELSYELYTMSSHDQGVACELMVIDHMKKFGVDGEIEHTGGHRSHDISLYVGGCHKKAEVKSAVFGITNKQFYFRGIKKDRFDILFLCFIHPERGVIVKTVSHDDIMEACKNKKYKVDKTGREHGYDIYFNESMTRKDMLTVEWNPEQTRMEVTV